MSRVSVRFYWLKDSKQFGETEHTRQFKYGETTRGLQWANRRPDRYEVSGIMDMDDPKLGEIVKMWDYTLADPVNAPRLYREHPRSLPTKPRYVPTHKQNMSAHLKLLKADAQSFIALLESMSEFEGEEPKSHDFRQLERIHTTIKAQLMNMIGGSHDTKRRYTEFIKTTKSSIPLEYIKQLEAIVGDEVGQA